MLCVWLLCQVLTPYRAALQEHSFLGVTKQGVTAIFNTQGNKTCHVVLRGAEKSVNYDEASVNDATARLEAAKLTPNIMVQPSHSRLVFIRIG